MKSLNEYVNNVVEQVILDDIDLQQVYENLYDTMFNDEGQLNEGLFGWLGKKAQAVGDKLASGGEKADEKINKMTDAGKKAVASVKDKAGKKWNKIKDAYTSVVSAIDTAVQKAKNAYGEMLKQANIKIENFEASCAKVYANAMDKVNGFGDKFSDYVKDVRKMNAINTLVAGALMCKAVGVDGELAVNALIAAGIK